MFRRRLAVAPGQKFGDGEHRAPRTQSTRSRKRRIGGDIPPESADTDPKEAGSLLRPHGAVEVVDVPFRQRVLVRLSSLHAPMVGQCLYGIYVDTLTKKNRVRRIRVDA